MNTKTAPTPTPETPLYTYGDYLADTDGHLYEPTGTAVIVDGKHATIAAIEPKPTNTPNTDSVPTPPAPPADHPNTGPRLSHIRWNLLDVRGLSRTRVVNTSCCGPPRSDVIVRSRVGPPRDVAASGVK